MAPAKGMTHAALRKFCLALPGATEDVKWGDALCFCVAEKIFTIIGLKSTAVSLKVDPPLFDALTTREAVRPAPYLARYHWVRIDDSRKYKRNELEALLRGSYALVVAKLPKSRRP